MSGYQIRRRFAEHSGGTKAYQIYEFQKNGAVAVVFQWGAFSPGMEPTRMGGQLDIRGVYTASVAEGNAKRQQGAKMNRGYGPWTVDVYSAADETEFVELVQQLLGTEKGRQVVNAINGDERSSTVAPNTARENGRKGKTPAIEESHPDWGSW